MDLQHQYNVETPPLQAIRAAAAAAANVERNVRSIDMSNKWSHQCCMTLPTASRRTKLAGARAEDMSPTHVIKQPAGRPISILDRMMLLLLLLDDVLYFVHYILWTTTLLRRDMHTYIHCQTVNKALSYLLRFESLCKESTESLWSKCQKITGSTCLQHLQFYRQLF